MSATRRSSSARPRGSLCCVERCWREGGPDARKRPTHCGHDQCRLGGERGSEVSPRGFRQDQLIQRQIRNSTSEPIILLLKALQFLQLIHAHPTVLLPPAAKSLFGNADPPDRIKTGLAPSEPQPAATSRQSLLASTACLPFSILRFLIITADHFTGGGLILSYYYGFAL